MMWTRGKSKRQDPLVDIKGVYAKYNKIVLIINSCQTYKQLESCKQLVNNFQTWCFETKINPNVYVSLVVFLNEKIENKNIRLS